MDDDKEYFDVSLIFVDLSSNPLDVRQFLKQSELICYLMILIV